MSRKGQYRLVAELNSFFIYQSNEKKSITILSYLFPLLSINYFFFYHRQVKVFSRIPPQFKQSEKFTEFPVQMALSSVIKPQPNILKIESLVGLVVYCKLDEFSCNVTVSGYYHNKTLGKIFRCYCSFVLSYWN